MQFTVMLSVDTLALGVAVQRPVEKGQRDCLAGAISCQYESGRYANKYSNKISL
jgi:hypothetical protein